MESKKQPKGKKKGKKGKGKERLKQEDYKEINLNANEIDSSLKQDSNSFKEKVRPKHKSAQSISSTNSKIDIFMNYYIQPSFTFQQEDVLSELIQNSTRPFILGCCSPILLRKVQNYDIIINVFDFLTFRSMIRI